MQILLSCAKTMADTPAFATPRTTAPRFAAEADALAAELAALPVEELARALRVNPRIAAENHRRYLCFHDAPARAALAAYTGIVFQRIAPAGFGADDFEYAQRHLNITSFLYGLLRPLDAIRPYRLEGGVRLGDDRTTLFDFWAPRLTDCLIERVTADDGILVNLASDEMKRLFDWRRVCRSVRVVTPACRGAMTRHLLLGRIERPEALGDFAWEGFRRDPGASRPDAPLFVL